MSTWKQKKPLRRNLYMQVVQELGLRIAKGDINVGDPLPIEDELGEEFGVSRTVVREATKVLSGKGLVCSRPKLGTLVQDRREWNMLDPDVLNWEIEGGSQKSALRSITDVREVIEPQASKLAALRASEEEIEKMELAYLKMEGNVESSPEFINADLSFHNLIIESSQSPILVQLSSTLRDALMACRRTIVLSPSSSREALAFHHDVLLAIQARKPDLAFSKMQLLIENAWLDIDEVLASSD